MSLAVPAMSVRWSPANCLPGASVVVVADALLFGGEALLDLPPEFATN